MRAQIKLGRIFGVDIGLHYSWFIIAFLITFSLAGQFQETNPRWSDSLKWGVAIITAVLFFVCIVIHELSHALVAKARGLPVRSITLFALGGLAQIEKEAADAKTEFWMGIIGPITSFVIGVVCLVVITFAFGWMPPDSPQQPLPAMLMWLGYINIALAIFNMIPGFPLDGGRVLRGIVWWITGNGKRATTIAARVGQFIAFAMIIYGVMQFFRGAGFNGLWLAFIGWFLLSASRESYAQMVIGEQLRGLRVADVMSRDFPVVDAYTNLQTFVEELTHTGRRFFVVTLNGRPEGIITPHQVSAIQRNRWPYTTVADVMRPLDAAHAVKPNTSVTEALELMAQQDLNQLPVIGDGGLIGLISRAHILQLIQTRAELHV